MTGEDCGNQVAPEAVEPSIQDSGITEVNQIYDRLRQRADFLVASGLREGHARGLSQLELRIAQWPAEWGDDLVVLIYGDLDAPLAKVEFPELGITIEPEKVTTSFIKSALCVLKARVKIPEKSVEALTDAARRMNTLLGVSSVLNNGNPGCGWWSAVTHGTMVGVGWELEPDQVQKVIEALENLPASAKRSARSALYWIREPRQLMMEGYRSDVLRVYAGYWNAFECLVEVICLLSPQPKASSADKNAAIERFLAERHGKLDVTAISDCYKEFVNPGFVAKASHALKICFVDKADGWIVECFKMKPDKDRLYNIRNAINHGDVDADNIGELLRVEDRFSQLWRIVFGMMRCIIPI